MTTSFVVYDSLGTAHTVDMTMVLEDVTPTESTWRWYADCADNAAGGLSCGTGLVSFDTLGQFSADDASQIVINLTQAQTPLVVTPDFASMTQLASERSELAMASQDGAPFGTLISFSMDQSGLVVGAFSNGLSRSLGQVVLATFRNPNGLLLAGSNMFRSGPNSGLANTGAPATASRGRVRGGALEQSTTDFAEQFTELIGAQTGFRANARLLSTTDRLISELMDLIR